MKKFLRGLARDHRGAAIGSSFFAMTGAVLAFVSPELGLAVAGSSPVVGSGVGKIVQYLSEEESWSWYSSGTRLEKSHVEFNGFRIVGKRSDLKKVIRMQKLIDRTCSAYKTVEILPQKIQQKIVDHARDVQPVLERCKVFLKQSYSSSDAQQSYFQFKRKFYNEKGNQEEQVLISVELLTKEEAKKKFEPIVLASIESQKLQAQFDAAAKAEAAQKAQEAEQQKKSRLQL